MSLNKALPYDSKEHRVVLQALLDRKRLSERKMTDFHEDWRSSEEQFRAYTPETDADALRRVERGSRGTPQFTTVFVPYTYAILLTIHTYHSSVFLGRSPVHQFMGRHGEGEMQVQALEALLQYQTQVGNMLGPYYCWLHDILYYGIGAMWGWWDEEVQQVSQIEEVKPEINGIPIPWAKPKKQRVVRRLRSYAGNKALNVRIWDLLLDPRVSLMDFQRGEFVGRKAVFSWRELVKGEEDGQYFNTDRVKRMALASQEREQYDSGQLDLPESDSLETQLVRSVDNKPGFQMVVDLIPRDWKLGESSYPEKWVFTVIDDKVVVEARPQGNLHGKFPLALAPNEIDPYSLNTRSLLEIGKPLNDTITWLFNSHFYNVRAALNNSYVVDPSKVVLKDITRPNEGGKIIRVRESMYGKPVGDAIQQLQTYDVTQRHLSDAQVVSDLLLRVLGASENLMGMVNPGKPHTATEIRSSNAFGVNRQKTMAEFWSSIAFEPWSQMLVQNTQQYYDMEQQFRIAGDNIFGRPETMLVSPEAIAGFFDFVPVDGTLPLDRFAQANLWKEILMGVQRMPQIAQQYNLGGIFEWMSMLAGLKNIRQFRVQAVPDEQLAAMSQQGNAVPMGGSDGAARAAGGITGGSGGIAEPGQVPNLGPTA